MVEQFDTTGYTVVNLADEGLAPGDTIDGYLSDHVSSGTAVLIPAGEYEWDGGDFDADGGAIVGDYTDGEQTVFNVTSSATVDGSFEDCEVWNITIKGENGDSKSGFDLGGDAHLHRLVWTDGAYQDEDRIFYNPSSADAPNYLYGCVWARGMNNGCYTDKVPTHFSRCVAANNNIAGMRIGDRNGVGGTSVIDQSLVTCTERPPDNESGAMHARGVRMRHPGHTVVRDSWFVYVDDYGPCIEIHDGAEGDSSLTFEGSIHFHVEGGARCIRDKANGSVPVDWSDATVTVSGGDGVYDFDGWEPPEYTEIPASEANVPTPSALTGVTYADTAVDVGHEVFDHTPVGGDTGGDTGTDDGTGGTTPDDGSDGTTGGTDGDSGSTDPDPEPTGDLLTIVAMENGPVDYVLKVAGSVTKARVSDTVGAGGNDTINEDGDMVTIHGFTGNPGYGDAYYVDGTVLSYEATNDSVAHEVRLNGELATFAGADTGSGDDSGTDTGTDDGTGGTTPDDGSDGTTGDVVDLTDEQRAAIVADTTTEVLANIDYDAIAANASGMVMNDPEFIDAIVDEVARRMEAAATLTFDPDSDAGGN